MQKGRYIFVKFPKNQKNTLLVPPMKYGVISGGKK